LFHEIGVLLALSVGISTGNFVTLDSMDFRLPARVEAYGEGWRVPHAKKGNQGDFSPAPREAIFRR
jgi:hypothetical protein